jgi:hypothetical protein
MSLFRHSEDMIKKLENAGLGFYMKETETHQKLGRFCLYNIIMIVYDLSKLFQQARSPCVSWYIVYLTFLPA